MLRKFISIIILLFVISVIVTVSLFMSNTTDKKVITSSSNEESLLDVETSTSEFSNTNLETIDHDRLRETLNLSLRVIEAMLNKDYDYWLLPLQLASIKRIIPLHMVMLPMNTQ